MVLNNVLAVECCQNVQMALPEAPWSYYKSSLDGSHVVTHWTASLGSDGESNQAETAMVASRQRHYMPHGST